MKLDISGKEIDLKHRDSILDERGTLTIDKGWEDLKERLWCEVMEDYLVTAELGHLAKDEKRHKQEMRDLLDKLVSTVQNLLAEQKAEIIERVGKLDFYGEEDAGFVVDEIINEIKEI